tara:strand:- start:305 stop:1900 length:1596 start_codon:yes stop_codon:yes gene_type:complete
LIKINFKMKLEKRLTYLLILIIGFISGILFSSLEYNIFNIDKLIQKIKLNDSTSYEYKSNSEKLNHIFQTINKNYVDSINYVKFENELINTILTKLDPHSSYISVDNFKSIQEDMQGSFSGIGIEFKIIEDTIVVVSAISGGPSEKLGIQSGDRIIKVENENVASIGITNEDVIELLRGEKGSIVNIVIKRKQKNKHFPFKIVRDDIPLISVDAGVMLTHNIGLIKINRFSATTYEEMIVKSDSLKKEGMEKLVLDLRSNPGGYLHIANQICDEFLKNNELIVYTEGDKRGKQEYFATKKGSLESIGIVVLINEGSASASEIIAGAIQDNDRGIIIGKRSFGKGLVQEQIILNDGSVMRLTTQRYYTPSGRCIQTQYGKNENNAITKKINEKDSLKFYTKNGRIVYGGGGINPDFIIKDDSNENYSQINLLLFTGIISDFCLEESIILRKNNIKNYTEININKLYNKFLIYVKNKENDLIINLQEKELKYLKNLLLATTSRNLWGSNFYYKILSQEDKYIQLAITKLKEKN